MTNESNEENKFVQGCLLMRAAFLGDKQLVESILQADSSSVNFADYDRRTPLHVAVSEGHLELAKFLVEKGAAFNCSDRWGGSPLDDALRHKFSEVARFLRSLGGTPGTPEANSQLLINAAAKGDGSVIRSLLEGGEGAASQPDLNCCDYDRRTPLHVAAGEGHIEVISLLIDAGANVNAEDRWGGRPLDDARRLREEECAAFLLSKGAIPGDGVAHGAPANSNKIVDGIGAGLYKDNLTVDLKQIELVERIGGGSFGDVFKCRWRGMLVAAKCIKTKFKIAQNDDSFGTKPSNEDIDQAHDDILLEISLLVQLRHPNICLLLAYSTNKDYELIISELMRCSLRDVLDANAMNQTKISKTNKYILALDLAQGMNYLHTCDPPIIHRDLKPENLLISSRGQLKISDFGLATLKPLPNASKASEDQFAMTGETGSYRFMAPEVFMHEKYDESVDVYSFAIIFFTLLKDQQPWPTLNGLDAARRAANLGARPLIPRSWDKDLVALMCKCWSEDKNMRPKFDHISATLETHFEAEYGCSPLNYSKPSKNCVVS